MKPLLPQLVISALLACCSTQIEEPLGVILDCQAIEDECPLQSEVAHIVEVYSETEVFSPRETLIVSWYDASYIFRAFKTEDGETFYVKAQTDGPNAISVTGCRYLPHELKHAQYMRAGTEDGDPNHEAPPGPWTTKDNETTREIANKVCL